jgi:hypothetical protein
LTDRLSETVQKGFGSAYYFHVEAELHGKAETKIQPGNLATQDKHFPT